MAIAEVSRFFGLDPFTLEEIDAHSFYDIYEAMEIIKARELLLNIEATAFPHKDAKARKETMKNLQKRAFPTYRQETVTGNEMLKRLQGWQTKK